MVFSKRSLEGQLSVDHRASPGMPVRAALQSGFDPTLCGEGKLFETATLKCAHCGGVWVANPERQRPRNTCRRCDAYLCDGCAQLATKPDYVHRSFAELVDMICSGKYIMVGGSMAEPQLVPTNQFTCAEVPRRAPRQDTINSPSTPLTLR